MKFYTTLTKGMLCVDSYSTKTREIFPGVCFKKFFSSWSWLGTSWVSFPVYAFLWIVGNNELSIALLLGEFFNHLVMVPTRYLIKRERPTPYPEKHIVLDPWNRYSFPSAHAARSAMVSCTCLLLTQLPVGVLLLWALSMGITRLYLLKHYISDIAAGFLLGGVSALISVNLLRYFSLSG